jgi:hypothetical protein
VNLDDVYNPLDKQHLADSIARAFFQRPVLRLPPPERFHGAGIYAIYYKGSYPLYAEFSKSLRRMADAVKKVDFSEQPVPIYIGKSDAPGRRKGASVSERGATGSKELDSEGRGELEEAREFLTKKPTHRKLYNRLVKHSKSINAATNLDVSDFFCRYMLVDEIWVPLGEARLVELFKPLWNVLIEGFGSNPEGGGRKNTARPVWDILHPGRKDSLGIRVNPESEASIVDALRKAETIEELRSAIDAHRRARLAFNKAQHSDGDPAEESDE